MAAKKKKLNTYVIAVAFLCGLAFLILNDDGLLKYMRLQNEVAAAREQISNVNKENKKLEGEIDSLKRKVPASVEKVAREKYHMIREGEKVIKVN